MVFVFSELERLLVEDRECQDRYTVVKYKEEVCISKVLKEMVNLGETKWKKWWKRQRLTETNSLGEYGSHEMQRLWNNGQDEFVVKPKKKASEYTIE